MTEAAAPAPATTPEPAQPQEPPTGALAGPGPSSPSPDERTPKERVRDRMRELRAQLKEKTAGIEVVSAEAGRDADGQAADPAKASEGKLGEEGPKEGEEKRDDGDKADKDHELEAIKAKRQLANAAEDLREARTELKGLKDKLAAHEGRLERAKTDPIASLTAFREIFGRDYGEYTKWLVENRAKIESSRRYADLPDEVREELELAKRERAERQQREQASADAAKLTGYAKNVAQYLTENAEEYPITAKLDWAAEDLARTHGIGKVRPGHIAAFEKQLTTNLAGALAHEVVAERLLRDEKVLASIQAALSKKQQQPSKSPAVASPTNGASAPADGPRGLSNSTSTGSVVRSPSEKPDRRQMLIAEMQRLRAEQARGAT